MAVNKFPFVKNLRGAGMQVFPGKVQIGSTQAIKMGEICTYDETSGYFIPVDAVADCRYALAIANEEQKADSLERYMEFIALREDDVFEFILDAVASIYLGDGLELTASDSQKLTRDVDGNAVAFVVGIDHYPEVGTTVQGRTYAQVSFHPVYSYWMQRVLQPLLKKYIDFTTSVTAKIEDCGAVFTSTGGGTITAPNGIVPVGWWIDIFCVAAAAVIFDPKPDTCGVVIKGGVQANGKYISITDEGDFMRVLWNGTNWVAISSISGADGDITVET